jgi:hypothetical protein
MTGKEICETTWNGTMRLAEDGAVKVTWTTDPRWAPSWRMVVPPSAICPSRPGKRPLTMENTGWPRKAVAATAGRLSLLMEISVTTPWVIPATALSCSRLPRRAGLTSAVRSVKLSWEASPYSRGVAVK